MGYFALMMLPSGFVSAGIAWYLGASSLRRIFAALVPLAIIWTAFASMLLVSRAWLRVDFLFQTDLFYIGLGLLIGGLPFFFRDQRLSLLPHRWIA
jgi:hypothetical protein